MGGLPIVCGDPFSVPVSHRSPIPAFCAPLLALFLIFPSAVAQSYRWKPFEPVTAPAVPKFSPGRAGRNPIDAFLQATRDERKLNSRPEAAPEILLRRIYLDLIGLSPTPAEQRDFARDTAPGAYERVVDRLLADPRYGERWGRHWMDVWRYSDWAGWSGGKQIRDSQPHIWRWRDWIVESLNADRGYDRMVMEMLAADELAPEDSGALRATGFLVRNYKMLSREQWLEDTVKHTSQAFLGLTVGCAKCHDHMFDPISQREYYQMRSIFEPHQVRIDRVPGEVDTTRDGLARVFDTVTNGPTYFYFRGDERRPDTNQVMSPGTLKILGGTFQVQPVNLPPSAIHPDRRDFVTRDLLEASEKTVAREKAQLAALRSQNKESRGQELTCELAEARHQSLLRTLRVERLEDQGGRDTDEWKSAAMAASEAQRGEKIAAGKLKTNAAAVVRADLKTKLEAAENLSEGKKGSAKIGQELQAAIDKEAEAVKALAEAEKSVVSPAQFKAREMATFPATSSGRRLALARWLTNPGNPLTARVAANQIWLRHFGMGLVATPADFGANGRAPSHPQLLDWLASELMQCGWSMKHLHRLIVTSAAYRMASTPNEADAKTDPDNIYLWRFPSRRMESELVRDNLLSVAGDLELTQGGPEIDQNLGLSSPRRSIYLRQAAEKEVEFLKIFDGPAVTECYSRKPTVVPQQALALANSELTLQAARSLARRLAATTDPALFAREAIAAVLARPARDSEIKLCQDFLSTQERDAPPGRARENLILVLFNHNDFITIR